jgi:predicted dehydrogenase
MKPIRWGIFGTGAVAASFAEDLRAVGRLEPVELAAVASRSRARADVFARTFGATRAYGSYEELAQAPDVDVVYVATPSSAHAEHAILAIERGKPVLCEKPFTVDGVQARRVIEAARRSAVFCMEGMWMRFAPLVRELRRVVSEGAVGQPRMLTANLGFPYERDPRHRLFDPAMGGGALLDLGVYALSFAFHFLGRPTGIEAQAVIGPTGVDEQVAVLLTFAGERQAVLTASLRTRMSNDAAILGDAGMIRVHEPLYCPESATIVRTKKHAGVSGGGPGRGLRGALKSNTLLREAYARITRARSERSIVRRRLGNGYAHEAIEVMRCLREGAKESPVMPLDESLAIIETIDAIRVRWSGPRSSS